MNPVMSAKSTVTCRRSASVERSTVACSSAISFSTAGASSAPRTRREGTPPARDTMRSSAAGRERPFAGHLLDEPARRGVVERRQGDLVPRLAERGAETVEDGRADLPPARQHEERRLLARVGQAPDEGVDGGGVGGVHVLAARRARP